MEQIRNYVEALFASLPKTKDIVQMKLDMLENLEEKYHAYLAEGKNENEAAGLVIASIGSLDDLRAELGLSEETSEAPLEDARTADPALAAEYRKFKTSMGVGIAVAVALFILSPVSYIFGVSVFSKTVGIFLFFLCIAAGVGLCILFGVREEYYEDMLGLKKKDDEGSGRLTKLFSAIAFPIAAVIYLCLGFFADLWHPGWIIFVVTGVLTGAIAAIEEYRRG
ncbi:permease prefix domain 1-containing protein [Agathobaculum sp.]|uniref:permease prefix domain 1-containing protein n=1 Tax=Agathobaculum sp. TaxID=2048138 RepID=UPI002A83C02A|nr:permease prefix domain 1-containing protein [Agathobaculum sp.]MDY3618292.1 permease prefix domain 1-containing protein [Agathobaculum sp.]